MSSHIASKKLLMECIYEHFAKDERFVLLAGDMGFAVLDKFFEDYPTRAFNLGINEQATVSIAAGLAKTGMRPIIYSQAPFITMRAFEQLRYDVNEHNLDVKIIGVGVDNYFSALGRSHCMDDDDLPLIGILKNIQILTPSIESVKSDVNKMFEVQTPFYIRSI
ncbi:Transketolase, C-terminal section [Pseudoalteromonas luteoviolacea B = ATCC 29581]|nr:Transketolase, C-terminal section [Pseudoalteromonas luteoviolacea B = ATCC 29581]